MSQSLHLVGDLALVLDVIVEDPEIVGVQRLAEITGEPTKVGRSPQQVALLNFLLQLRLVELHPGEVLDDVLDVVEELVGGDGEHEQSVRVLREMLVPGLEVSWEVGGADLTPAVTRQ